MTDPGPNMERQSLEALKAIGKALGQMALYKVGHPAVAETVETALQNLAAAVELAGGGELVISVDQQKFIANGRMIGTAAQLPNSIPNFFNRFKLNSLTFSAGLTHEDVAALCELAAARADSPTLADPKGFLAGRNVRRISLNEATYVKSSGQGAGAQKDGAGGGVQASADAGAGGAGAEGAEEKFRDVNDAIQSASLERTLHALVAQAVPDPVLRAKVMAQVMKLLEADIAKRVEEVMLPLKREKKTVENEAVRTTNVISNMVEGVVVVDDQGKILMMNPAAEQIYGSALSQTAGKGLAEKVSDQFIVTMASEISTPNDRDVSREVKVSGADETRRTLKASSAVVQTEAGKIVGMVTALPDAVKHKELQKMQRDFIAHVTHELRAPLSSIRAALEIIQGEFGAKMEDEETRMLTTALKNSDRLADMINSILDFSKLESGQMTVYPKPCEPGVIAQEAVDSLQPWAQKKRITLVLEAPGGLPSVESDAPRTIQVLVNILSNALKFTPAGGRITVKLARRLEGNKTFVEFSVADTGPGIPKSEQSRVFEKFVQIAAGETHIGGTGLGLSIAKALVHLQKGKMWLESEPGQGATFLFTLPVQTTQTDGAISARLQAGRAATSPWWKKMLGLK
ncbi:MAG: ATP-binding protein [Elusimicrobiota bacterium]